MIVDGVSVGFSGSFSGDVPAISSGDNSESFLDGPCGEHSETCTGDGFGCPLGEASFAGDGGNGENWRGVEVMAF